MRSHFAERSGGAGSGRLRPRLIWAVQVKLRAGARVASLIIGCTERKPHKHSRAVALCYDSRFVVTFTVSRTCSSIRYESRAPERVYSAGRCCLDCGARRSNDARGQRATVVYARLAHGPSGGGRRPAPARPRATPSPHRPSAAHPARTTRNHSHYYHITVIILSIENKFDLPTLLVDEVVDVAKIETMFRYRCTID